jgi:hypothetical protein
MRIFIRFVVGFLAKNACRNVNPDNHEFIFAAHLRDFVLACRYHVAFEKGIFITILSEPAVRVMGVPGKIVDYQCNEQERHSPDTNRCNYVGKT